MAIHHSQVTKAGKMGVQLEEHGGMIRATWPMRNLVIYGIDARYAIEQMSAAQALIKMGEEEGFKVKLVYDPATPVACTLYVNGEEFGKETPAVHWSNKDAVLEFAAELLVKVTEEQYDAAEREDTGTPKRAAEFLEDKPHSMGGVPTDGGQAFRDGHAQDENPFEEGSEEAEQWDQDYQEAEDAEDSEEEATKEAEPQAHSVVKSKYRARYAEDGHPTTCGDELATRLNNLLHNDGGTNLALLETICNLNEISLEKYNRTSNGWQGRLRMTARNMLAKKAREAGGVLKMPEMLGGELKLSSEWVGASKE